MRTTKKCFLKFNFCISEYFSTNLTNFDFLDEPLPGDTFFLLPGPDFFNLREVEEPTFITFAP